MFCEMLCTVRSIEPPRLRLSGVAGPLLLRLKSDGTLLSSEGAPRGCGISHSTIEASFWSMQVVELLKTRSSCVNTGCGTCTAAFISHLVGSSPCVGMWGPVSDLLEDPVARICVTRLRYRPLKVHKEHLKCVCKSLAVEKWSSDSQKRSPG